MASLLRLPPELRLQIYGNLLSRQPYHIYIDEFFAIDCQDEWGQLKKLLRFDPILASDIKSTYWHTNTFMIPEVHVSTPLIDRETSDWLRDHVQDNVKDLRYLQLGFSGRCRTPPAGITNPVCYNVVTIDVQRQKATHSKCGRRGDGCEHVRDVIKRLDDILASIPLLDGRKQLTEDCFWALYRSCGEDSCWR